MCNVLLKKCDGEDTKQKLLEAIDNKGRTALHCSTLKGHTEISMMLIDHST